MKKNKIFKSSALALGAIASVAAPIAAVVSCGSGTSDNIDKNKVLGQFVEASLNDPTNAVSAADKASAETLLTKLKTLKSDKEITAAIVASGLSTELQSLFKTALLNTNNMLKQHSLTGQAFLNQANDGVIKVMESFSKGGTQERALQAQVDAYNATKPTMRVELSRIEGGYGAEASTLTTKIEAGDTKTLPNLVVGYGDTLGTLAKYSMQLDLEKIGTKTTLRSKFEDKFMDENDNIGGLDGTKGTYIIPLSKSTEVNNINKEVIGYILTQLKDAGVTVSGTKLDSIMSGVKLATDKGEQTFVGKKWGSIDKNDSRTKAALAKIGNLDDSIFTDYSKMISFATNAQEAFKNTRTDKNLHVLGIDAPANLIYSLAYAELGNKPLSEDHSFLFSKIKEGADKGYLGHPWLKDKTSPEANALKSAYGLLKDGLQNGALMMNGGGAYSSQTEVKHEIGMAIGSTAGYSHNFVQGASTTFTYAVTSDGKTVDKTMGYTDELNLDDLTFGKYKNKLILGTPQTGYNVGTNAGDDTTNAAALIAAAKADKSIHLAISSDSNAASATGSIKVADNNGHPKFLVSTASDAKLKATVVTTDGSLQEDELELEQAPTTLDGATSKSIFSQGPSLIGVHANAAEDAATREFVNWLTSKNAPGTSYDAQDDKSKNLKATPIEEFDREASYIGVLKGAFSEVDATTGLSKAQIIAFNGFKDAVETESYRIFTNPIDDQTSSIRDAFDTVMILEYNKRATSNVETSKVDTMDGLYGKLQANAHIQ